jgi:hypothetical protein
MYLVAIGWLYVVLMMAVAEVVSTQGTVLGAVITIVLYGLLPVSIVLYLMAAPMRRRQRLAAQAAEAVQGQSSPAPDGSSLSPGDAVAAERKEV